MYYIKCHKIQCKQVFNVHKHIIKFKCCGSLSTRIYYYLMIILYHFVWQSKGDDNDKMRATDSNTPTTKANGVAGISRGMETVTK